MERETALREPRLSIPAPRRDRTRVCSTDGCASRDLASMHHGVRVVALDRSMIPGY